MKNVRLMAKRSTDKAGKWEYILTIPYVKDHGRRNACENQSALESDREDLEEQLLRLQLILIHIRHILQGFR